MAKLRTQARDLAARLKVLPALRRARTTATVARQRVDSELRVRGLRRPTPRRTWDRGLASEVTFWERNLTWRIRHHPAYADRFDPHAPLTDPAVARVVEGLDRGDVAILDVGAGPLSTLGRHLPGRRIAVTTADPLAEEYRRILAEMGLEPPDTAVASAGEDLLERFAPATFDVTYARNALDHAYDPLRVIDNMVALTRPGGSVVLRHKPAEAVRERYTHLHQWNLEAEDGRLVLWQRRSERHDVTARLADRADVRTELALGWVVAVITPRPAA